MSQQLAFSSIASVLAMACLCLAAGSIRQADAPAYDALAVVSAEASGLPG
ncbi:hypothetical protein [Erythrobacter sp.]|nr:hypothetical protein [Erythrobacter sp.]QIQ85339.1 MAG: hypothetical protein G9473_00565 [Erythrobacter sp.]